MMGRRSRSRRLVPALTARLVDAASLPGGILVPAPRGCRRIFDAHSQPQPMAARSTLSVEEQPPPRTPYPLVNLQRSAHPNYPFFGAPGQPAAPNQARQAVPRLIQANDYRATSTRPRDRGG